MDGGIGGVSGEGGASAQGPSTTYKYGVTPGSGANRENIGGKKRKGKTLPTMPAAEQSLPGHVRVRPQRKRNSVSGGTTMPADSAR